MNTPLQAKQIGENILDARRSQGITQVDLASKTEISQSQISRLEKGLICPPPKELIDKIAVVLGVETTVLLSSRQVALPIWGYCENGSCRGSAMWLDIVLCDEVGTKTKPQIRVAPYIAQLSNVAETRYCPFCGIKLKANCPDCGAPINEGAYCLACGASYISPRVLRGLQSYLEESPNITLPMLNERKQHEPVKHTNTFPRQLTMEGSDNQ